MKEKDVAEQIQLNFEQIAHLVEVYKINKFNVISDFIYTLEKYQYTYYLKQKSKRLHEDNKS